MSQFAALAEPIDRLGGYVEECSDVTNRQQRPQPVRRILGERCRDLRNALGEKYAEYQERVPMLVPRLTRR